MDRTISARRVVELLAVVPPAAGPAYHEVGDGIRRLIADGRIPAGVRLPSERDLTGALGVSRTTVTRAYGMLRDLGFVQSRQGSGSVAALPGSAPRRTSVLSPAALDLERQADVIDLTCAALTAAPGFLAASEAAVATLPAHLGGRGYHPYGLPELRQAIADQFAERGLPTDPEQVMITSGALTAFAATARALLGPGDRILMESPTYPNAIETARRSGARPVALPLDPDGWDTAALTSALRQTAPRAAFLIPDFHNPTGALMPEDQRRDVGRALQSTHTVPVIDETLVDLALDGLDHSAPRPMACSNPRTITVGGASKTYWGGLRIGWVRAPRDLMTEIADARLTIDLSAPLLEQLILLELLQQRDAVLAYRRERIRASRDALVAVLAEQLPDWRFTVPGGGLSIWIELPQAASSSLATAAEREGVIIPAGPQFAVEGGMERFLRIPYGDQAPEVLVEAVRRLAVAWQQAGSVTTARRGRSALVA